MVFVCFQNHIECLERLELQILLDYNTHCDNHLYFISNGQLLTDCRNLQQNDFVNVNVRFAGGKGGFGSLLRFIGSQIEKTTNKESCRDLSGKRLRDVNNEKRLKEWLAKEKERKLEREAKEKERLQRLKEGPNHKFEDNTYFNQKKNISERLEEGIEIGLKRKSSSPEEPCLSRKKAYCVVVPDDLLEYLSDEGAEVSDNSTLSDNVTSSEMCTPSTSSAGNSEHNTSEQTSETNDSSITSPICVTSDSINEFPEKDSAFILENMALDGLLVLDMDFLKEELRSRGLKCGGTLAERAQRLYAVKGLLPSEFPEELKANGKTRSKKR